VNQEKPRPSFPYTQHETRETSAAAAAVAEPQTSSKESNAQRSRRAMKPTSLSSWLLQVEKGSQPNPVRPFAFSFSG
jgi:hypothetical protein